MRMLFFILFIVPQCFQAQNAVWPEQLEVTAASLKLRAAPNLDAAVLTTIPQGAIVENMSSGSYVVGQRWLEQHDFKIWASQKDKPSNSFHIKQDLTPFFNPREKTAVIKWWGDLDGDDKPDVLIGRCAFGEGGCTDYLFLSSKAQVGEILRLATVFFWGMGC